jgi:hypothetical protein
MVGVEVAIVHPSFRMSGSAVDFEAAFYFDGVVPSKDLKQQSSSCFRTSPDIRDL